MSLHRGPNARRHHHVLGAYWPLAALALAGCLGYRTPLDGLDDGEPRRDAAADLPARGTWADGGRDQAIESRPLLRCAPGTPYVLVLGTDASLYHLDTDTLTLTSLAAVSCGNDSLNSMTVSPVGPAYISSQSGQLCSVDLASWKTTLTSFNPASIGNNSFGMALLPDASPAGQTLFIASQDPLFTNQLSRIDLTTFRLSTVGPILPTVPWAELTAGPNGELYGFAIGPVSSQLLNIDPGTGSAIDITTVPAGYTAAAFGLVYWQDVFYLFVGPSSSSPGLGPPLNAEIYRYRKGDAQVTHIGTLPVGVIGAGVAICR